MGRTEIDLCGIDHVKAQEDLSDVRILYNVYCLLLLVTFHLCCALYYIVPPCHPGHHI